MSEAPAPGRPSVRHSSTGARLVREVRWLVGAVAQGVRGRDVALVSAGLTYFAGIALVPWLLVGLWSATLVTSPATVTAQVTSLGELLPPEMGAPALWRALAAAGVQLGPLGAVVALVPATFYGEGLRRACLRLAPRPERFTGWRARLLVLPVAVLAPLGTAALLGVAGVLVGLARSERTGAGVLAVLVAFNVLWVVVGVLLTWVFRVVAPGEPGWRATVVGAFATSSILSGFLLGFVLFLSVPIDLGVPFGGLGAVGVVVAVGLWLFVLHTILLVGWTVTTALDRRLVDGRTP